MPVVVTCEFCGKTVEKPVRTAGSGRFCSSDCYKKSRRQENVDTMAQAKTRISVLEKELAKAYAQRSVVRQLVDATVNAVHDLPQLEIFNHDLDRPINDELDPEDVILHISDCQIGSWVSPEYTGGLGNYDYPVFCNRVDRYVHNVRKILRYHPNKIETCHIVLGGDIVDGGTIFLGHQRQIDTLVVKQVVYAYEHLSRIIADMAGMFDEVVVSCIPGNHGRIGKKGEMSPTDNMDWLAYYFLQERCASIENVRFNIPDTWWMVLKVRGWKWLISHGDDFKAWSGIPFYGALRYKNKMRELLSDTFCKNGEEFPDFDAILVGHHHELASFSNIFMNGNWVGGSEFSLKTLQAGGMPYQQMIGVHDRVLKAWYRPIMLEDVRTLPAMPVYS